MSTATSLVELQYGSTQNQNIQNRGKHWVRGTAVIPSGFTNCTVTNIPLLSPGSIVRVLQQASGGGTAKLINLKALNQNGNVGIIYIGTENGSAVSGDTPFMFEVEHF